VFFRIPDDCHILYCHNTIGGFTLTIVTADNKLFSELTSCDSLEEVRNEEGVVIGFFAPVRLEYALAAAKAYSTGIPRVPKTTSEVLANLESLEIAK